MYLRWCLTRAGKTVLDEKTNPSAEYNDKVDFR